MHDNVQYCVYPLPPPRFVSRLPSWLRQPLAPRRHMAWLASMNDS